MPTTDGTWPAEASRDVARRWPVAEALVASIGFCLALALWLAARRLSGALVEPLPLPHLLATAALASAWAWSMRAIGSRLWTHRSLRLLTTWAPLAVVLLVAVACSYPGHRGIDWVVWVLAIAAVWFAPSVLKPTTHSMAKELRSPAVVTDEPEGDVLQQFTRVRLAEGREAVRGVLVAEFAAGQDLATLYVGFCPPFERLPHVEAEMTDGPAANIKIVQVLHNGARLDVSLPRPAAAATRARVEFLAADGQESPA